MAEFKEMSKRKRPSLPTSRSVMGIFIHSKSHMHLHRKRSGQCQPNSTRGGNHQDLQPFVKKRKNSSPVEDSSVGYDLSSVSIKDLRLRRVFSPSSADGVIPNCLDDTEHLAKSKVSGSCLGGSQEAWENGGFKKLDMPNEDFVQSTPPDAEIFGAKQVVERNENDLINQFIEKKPSENLQKHDGWMEKGFQEERNGMNYSVKSVLKPCSRTKLFKTPGSFSYRRLLPYLLDIQKGSPTMGHCQKTEIGFEEKQLLDSNHRETLVDKSKTSGCSLDGHNNDSSKELKAVSIESFTLQDSGSSSMPLVNGEIQKLELQVTSENQKLICSKCDSSSTIEDSHFNEDKLAGVVSSDKMLKDDGESAKTNAESPCNAQNLEVLDQTLSTISDKCDSCAYDKVTQNCSDDTKQSEIEGMPKDTSCHSFEAQHLNSVNPVLSEMGGNRKCSLQRKFDNDGEDVEQVEDLNGECISMKAAGSDMSSKSETADSRGNRVNSVSGISHVTQKSTNESFHRNNGQGSDKSLDSSPKHKWVPHPWLHLKLSKISGSLSYRRLLPYLMDVTNNYSCTSGNDRSLKVEKGSKEKPRSPFFTSGKDTCMETFNGQSCPIEHHTHDDIMLPAAAATTAMRCSSNHKLTQSPSKQVADSQMIMDSKQQTVSIVKSAELDANRKSEASPKHVVESMALSSSSLINSGLLPREEGAELVANQLPLETEEDCVKSAEKCAKREKQIEADSFVKACNPLGIPSSGLRKGILKRNPRGCRGICTCMNCSSFRLHAERSFEFSRNQMQDAEEVTLDLIKELSYLRNMLEKTAFGSKDQTSICINQVKEACKKASDAEELAKTRLSEMNYELNTHCRIPCGQRPTVRFATCVKERVIPIADSSNK